MPLLSEIEYGFNNNLYQSEIDLKYRNSFNNSIKNLDANFSDREDYFQYMKICMNCFVLKFQYKKLHTYYISFCNSFCQRTWVGL